MAKNQQFQNILNLLKRQWSKNEWPHALKIEARGFDASECLNQFWQEIEASLHIGQNGQAHHSDILVFEPKKDYYTLDDLKELESFLAYASWHLPRKLIVFKKAEGLISKEIINGLLKALEDPPILCTFIFLKANGKAMLPTFEGRCLTYQINGPRPISNTEILQKYTNEKRPFQESLEELKASPEELEVLILAMMDDAYKKRDYKLLENLIENLKWFKKAEKVHNPPGERIYNLLTLFQS